MKDIKITEKDFKKAETALKAELAKRKSSQFRKKHELMWKAVDRQVAIDPPEVDDQGADEDWLNVFELGVLAQASEIMTADLLRVIFPDNRAWFEAHVEPPTELDQQTGDKVRFEKKLQDALDGRLRAMMTQQHIDFGLRDRVELSLKEALHHGMFVAEIREEDMPMYLSDNRVKDVSAPVWVPHSMWNCYPDPSPSLVGSSMFYRGSMFIQSYMPRHKFLESASGEGWIKSALKKIPKQENTVKDNQTKDLEIVTYWGDVVIPASGDGMQSSDNDLYFPNHKAILANGKLVYLEMLDTPYLPLVCKGYERMDVRDPYAYSPIIKQSPMQGIASVIANEFVNGVQLHVRPPLTYDGNDPEFIANGGPTIAPGAKSPTKGSASFKQMLIGEPGVALQGLQFCVTSMKESLGRPGIEVGSRATKAEVDTKQADSEAGPFGFAIKVDDALRTFLYMQHAVNLAKKDFSYSYYNPDVDSPDFLRANRSDLPTTVHFEVVGTKGMLGEARRHQAFSATTAFLMGHPLTAPMLEPSEIVKQMYQDAGMKSPERFIKSEDGVPPQVKAQIQQMQQLIQKLQQELEVEKSQSQVKLHNAQLNHDAKMAKIQSQHAVDVAELHLKADKIASDHNIATDKAAHEARVARLENIIREFEHVVELTVAKHGKTDAGERPIAGAMGIDLTAPSDIPATHPETGHVLHRDANGNLAYVGPNGEIQEVNNAV